MSEDNKTKQEVAGELLAKYKTADAEVARAKLLLDEANQARSDVVEEVYKAIGKGPFTYKGEYLGKIVVRGNTHFFRGKSEDGVKID
jgi:hypothetical protein